MINKILKLGIYIQVIIFLNINKVFAELNPASQTLKNIFNPIDNLMKPEGIGQEGIKNTALEYAGFARYILIFVALIMLVWLGISLIVASGDENTLKTNKKYIIYIVLGLILLNVGYSFMQILSETYDSGDLSKMAIGIYEIIFLVSKYVEAIILVIVLAVIVLESFQIITSHGDDAQLKKAITSIQWSLIGLVVVLIADQIVNALFGVKEMTGPKVQQLSNLIMNPINFILGFLASVAFVMMIYAGGLYVANLGNEEYITRAKKIIISCIIGLIIIMFAYFIANFFIINIA